MFSKTVHSIFFFIVLYSKVFTFFIPIVYWIQNTKRWIYGMAKNELTTSFLGLWVKWPMQSDKVKNAKHFMFCICDSGTQKNSDRNLLEIGEIKNYCGFVFHIRTRSVQKTNKRWLEIMKTANCSRKNI